MQNIYKLLHTEKNQNPNTGFTLIELLIATSITTIVVSITGFGLITIVQNNSKAEAETLRRIELNRALDFIADEVKMAKSIANNASTNLGVAAPGFNSAAKKPVLTLEIPGVSQRVIYYIKSPTSTDPWLGPRIVYRWGPNFNDNGQYTNPVNNPVLGNKNPANWAGEALVDLIANSQPDSATTCPTAGWNANPATSNGQGFTACVDPTGRVADIYLRGQVTDAYGKSLDPYQVSTRVFARSNTPLPPSP